MGSEMRTHPPPDSLSGGVSRSLSATDPINSTTQRTRSPAHQASAPLNAELASRLKTFEESILNADTELEDQQDLLRHSWTDTRTKADWWRRWEGYKPKSPWVAAQRTFPGT